MKDKLTKILLILFLGLFGWYFFTNIEDFIALIHLSPKYLILVILGHIAFIVTNGLFVKTMLKVYGRNIGYGDSFVASLISGIGNFFFPIGTGAVAQAKYLKLNHHFDYKKFATAMSGNYIIVFWITSLLALASLLLLEVDTTLLSFRLVFIFFLLVFLANSFLAVWGMPQQVLSLANKIREGLFKKLVSVMVEVINGWNLLVRKRKYLAILSFYVLLNFISAMIINYASIEAIGLSISLPALILYSALGSMAILINITPGSIGIRESIYVLTSTLIGLNTSQIFSIAIIDRSSRVLILLIGFIAMRGRFNTRSG